MFDGTPYKLRGWVNKDLLDRDLLSDNPNAIHLLEANPVKIFVDYLSLNPKAFNLIEEKLKKNPLKINWNFLSRNPSAIHLIEDCKMMWNEFSYLEGKKRKEVEIEIAIKNIKKMNIQLIILEDQSDSIRPWDEKTWKKEVAAEAVAAAVEKLKKKIKNKKMYPNNFYELAFFLCEQDFIDKFCTTAWFPSLNVEQRELLKTFFTNATLTFSTPLEDTFKMNGIDAAELLDVKNSGDMLAMIVKFFNKKGAVDASPARLKGMDQIAIIKTLTSFGDFLRSNHYNELPSKTPELQSWLLEVRALHAQRPLPFATARAIVRELKLESSEEWVDWSKEGERPSNIPSDPAKVYRDDGWISLFDWLGYEEDDEEEEEEEDDGEEEEEEEDDDEEED